MAEGNRGAVKSSETRTSDSNARYRRPNLWKVTFVTLLIVALLAVMTWLLLGSRLLAVRDIQVTSTNRLDSDQVKAAADVPTGTPLVRVDTDDITHRVQNLRLVDSAHVSRKWPATLRVEITERKPQLSVKLSDGYRLVDSDGVRIVEHEKRAKKWPLVTVSGEVKGNPAISTAADITQELPGSVRDKLDTITAKDPTEITLTLDDGAKVEWGDGERTKQKGKLLAVLIREHPPDADRGYDVSAPGMAVVR